MYFQLDKKVSRLLAKQNIFCWLERLFIIIFKQFMQRRENYLWLKCLSENFHPISHSHLDCGCLVSLLLFTTFRALILSPSTLERNKENNFGIWFSVSDRPWSKDDNGFQGWPHHHPAHHLSAGKVNSSFQDHIFWLYLRLGLFVNIFVSLFVCNLQCFFSLFFSSQQFPSNVFFSAGSSTWPAWRKLALWWRRRPSSASPPSSSTR